MNLKFIFSISVRKAVRFFYRNCIDSLDHFGFIDILIVLYLLIYEHIQLNLSNYLKIFFNWRIIALQCCVGF